MPSLSPARREAAGGHSEAKSNGSAAATGVGPAADAQPSPQRPMLVVVDINADEFEGVEPNDLWCHGDEHKQGKHKHKHKRLDDAPPTNQGAEASAPIAGSDSKQATASDADSADDAKEAEAAVAAAKLEATLLAVATGGDVVPVYSSLCRAAAKTGDTEIDTVASWTSGPDSDRLPAAAVVVFNACAAEAAGLDGVEGQMRELRLAAPLLGHRLEPNVPVLLVACVPDPVSRQVSCAAGVSLAKRYGAMYHELSAECLSSTLDVLFERIHKVAQQ